VTPAHVRTFKTVLLTTTSKRTGKPMAPATVQKWLNALRSVLSWGKRESYLTTNPAEGITVSAKVDREDGRQPYSAEDLRTLFSPAACEARQGKPADRWLPYLALYTGARLEELGQLRAAECERRTVSRSSPLKVATASGSRLVHRGDAFRSTPT
jgi:hypothetical protein